MSKFGHQTLILKKEKTKNCFKIHGNKKNLNLLLGITIKIILILNIYIFRIFQIIKKNYEWLNNIYIDIYVFLFSIFF